MLAEVKLGTLSMVVNVFIVQLGGKKVLKVISSMKLLLPFKIGVSSLYDLV